MGKKNKFTPWGSQGLISFPAFEPCLWKSHISPPYSTKRIFEAEVLPHNLGHYHGLGV